VGRCGAVDVGYPAGGGATGALVVADGPTFARVVEEAVAHLPVAAPYRPGALYLRELPALLAVVAEVAPLDLLVVDGFATLAPGGEPGLGAHAHDELGIPVIGVAKAPYRGASHAVPVRRGASARPLWVTSVGLPADEAAALVAGMAGGARLPDALRRADRLSRSPHPGPGRPS